MCLRGSSLDTMSRLEEFRDGARTSTKVRTGSIGKYRDFFSAADREYFQNMVSTYLYDSFGYDYYEW